MGRRKGSGGGGAGSSTANTPDTAPLPAQPRGRCDSPSGSGGKDRQTPGDGWGAARPNSQAALPRSSSSSSSSSTSPASRRGAGGSTPLYPDQGVMPFPETYAEIIPYLAVAAYVIACPYTKVEESFNMQATHDIMYQRNLSDFDHLAFPGVVPRTFIGPLTLSALCYPIVAVVGVLLGEPCVNTHALYVVRLALGFCHAGLLVKVSRSLGRMCGGASPCAAVQAFFLLISSVQFHELYYASRTLPNSFAMVGFLAAFHKLVSSEALPKAFAVPERLFAFQILAMTCLIFRGELVLIIGPLVLSHLITGRTAFFTTAYTGISTGVLAILGSTLVDSAFWGRLLWPEGDVLFFNVVLNKSHEWGVMPYHWYFTNALPKSMNVFYLLLPLSIVVEKRLRVFTVPAVLFVVLFSFLPHKELRFIFYAIPVFNASVAAMLSRIYTQRRWRVSLLAAFTCCALLSLAASVGLCYVSSLNYPGGDALAALHATRKGGGSVLIGTGPSMEGITRFQKDRCGQWTYSKDPSPPASLTFDYLITDEPDVFSNKGYRILANVTAFGGVDVARVKALDVWPPPITSRVASYLMEVSSTSSSRVHRIIQGNDLGP